MYICLASKLATRTIVFTMYPTPPSVFPGSCAGQDPGFSNRGGATSQTHMWAWSRFCIATLYCSTGSQVKGPMGLSHRSDFRLLHPLASLFVPDIMDSKVMLCLSTEYQACSDLWYHRPLCTNGIVLLPPISASVL